MSDFGNAAPGAGEEVTLKVGNRQSGISSQPEQSRVAKGETTERGRQIARKGISGPKCSVAVTAETEAGCVFDTLFALEVEDDTLALAEHKEDASLQASRTEVDLLPVVVAHDDAYFSGRIVNLNNTLHGPAV